jgi:hypothetical protein
VPLPDATKTLKLALTYVSVSWQWLQSEHHDLQAVLGMSSEGRNHQPANKQLGRVHTTKRTFFAARAFLNVDLLIYLFVVVAFGKSYDNVEPNKTTSGNERAGKNSSRVISALSQC